MGFGTRYEYYHVSRIESGSVNFEDAAVLISLDPEQRSWDWFIFGTSAEMPVKIRPSVAMRSRRHGK